MRILSFFVVLFTPALLKAETLVQPAKTFDYWQDFVKMLFSLGLLLALLVVSL